MKWSTTLNRMLFCSYLQGHRNKITTSAKQALAMVFFLAAAGWAAGARGQELPPTPPPATMSSPPQTPNLGAVAQQNGLGPCVQPPPMVRWEDYQGPFHKAVGVFARRLERKSVGQPRYKQGVRLCTLETKDKFKLFLANTFDPVTFLTAGFNAGIGQAENVDPSYGQGAAGFGTRFGAYFTDQAQSEFFKDFAYPVLFSEDPRYYRLGQGSAPKRLWHAVEHSFVAYSEDGTRMFNFSEWLGTTSAVVLSNAYHPDRERGVRPAARHVAYWVLSDAGFDVLREYWPEIARKFRLPFRDQNQTGPSPTQHSLLVTEVVPQ
jgi:hypothetical protein